MLVHHRDNGFIDHITSEPESKDVMANIMAEGNWIHLPPVALPAVAVRDADGKLVFEDGKVKRSVPGYTQPEVTHDYHMVADGRVEKRPTLPAGDVSIKADGIDTYVLDGLPAGSVLRLDGQEVAIDDGTLEFTTTEVGVYVFEAGFPFVDWQVKVTAIEVIET